VLGGLDLAEQPSHFAPRIRIILNMSMLSVRRFHS
jgi:hypothetical protein